MEQSQAAAEAVPDTMVIVALRGNSAESLSISVRDEIRWCYSRNNESVSGSAKTEGALTVDALFRVLTKIPQENQDSDNLEEVALIWANAQRTFATVPVDRSQLEPLAVAIFGESGILRHELKEIEESKLLVKNSILYDLIYVAEEKDEE